MRIFRYAMVLMLAAAWSYGKECTCPKLKMAYLDMNGLFTKYYKTVGRSVIFEKKKLEFAEKTKARQAALEAQVREMKRLEQEAKNELLDAKVRKEAEAKYRARAEVFIQKRSEYENEQRRDMQELRRMQMETESTLAAELHKFVKSYAKVNGYTHIYDISGETMNRMPALLVYPEHLDITPKLIAAVNRGHEKELEKLQVELESYRKKLQPEANKAKQTKK